jgi:hypothetical protein
MENDEIRKIQENFNLDTSNNQFNLAAIKNEFKFPLRKHLSFDNYNLGFNQENDEIFNHILGHKILFQVYNEELDKKKIKADKTTVKDDGESKLKKFKLIKLRKRNKEKIK